MKKNMTTAERYKHILLLSGPLVGAMVSQNLLNLVDSYMIGRLGTEALAAVGTGGIISWLAGSAAMSLSTGVQQLAARRHGEENHQQSAFPLNAGLICAAVFGVIIALTGSLFSEEIFSLMTDDKKVIADGSSYIQITFLAVPFNGMNFCFRGYWSAVNRQKIYMFTLFFMHGLNIFLNYCLIFGEFGFPELGVQGAGLATMISIASGSVIYFCMGFIQLRKNGFASLFPVKVFKSLIKLTIPNSIQSVLYALSYTLLYKIIADLGTAELAAAALIINFALVCYLPGMAMGLVATSLVGQSLGCKDPEDADLWARQTSFLAVIILGILSIPFIIIPEQLLSFFIQEKNTVETGVTALKILGASLWIEGIALVMQYSLLGAGDSNRVMYISTGLQWLFYLPLAWLTSHTLEWGLNGVWTANLLNQIALAIFFSILWKRGKWKEIKI